MSRLIWLLGGFAATLAVPARADEAPVDFAPVEQVALAELVATNTPGAAVAVVRGDRVVFARGFGVASVETKEPVRAEMLFRMGSTTKMFVAAALVGLAEEGKLKLDGPVGGAVKGLAPKVGSLTPHQLLTHTAGLREEVVWNGLHDDSALGANIRGWKDDRVVREPGERFAYCNPGYWLAGLAVEEAGGGPFADVMRDRLFGPLGMTRTTFRPTWAMTYPLAVGHDRDKDGKPFVVRPLADNAANWPAGSMFSSVGELSRWMVAFLNGGKLEGRQVLPPAVIEKMGTPHVDVGKDGVKYGYGLRVREWRGVRVVEHAGSRSGYGSTMMLVPAERVGVVVLANRTGSGLRPVAEKALELLVPSGR